jgi:hypothetical protein
MLTSEFVFGVPCSGSRAACDLVTRHFRKTATSKIQKYILRAQLPAIAPQ